MSDDSTDRPKDSGDGQAETLDETTTVVSDEGEHPRQDDPFDAPAPATTEATASPGFASRLKGRAAGASPRARVLGGVAAAVLLLGAIGGGGFAIGHASADDGRVPDGNGRGFDGDRGFDGGRGRDGDQRSSTGSNTDTTTDQTPATAGSAA